MEDLVRAIREARALSEVRRREQAKAVEKICEAERQLSHLERTLVESVPEAKQLLDALRANAQEVLS